MILIPLNHSNQTVDKGGSPRFAFAQRMITVILHVGLIHYIQSVVVTQSIHSRVVRIMTGAKRVHIKLLHHQDILNH